LDYFGKIHREDCRDTLKAAVVKMKGSLILGSAVSNLLHHHNPEDIAFVLDRYFDSVARDQHYDPVLREVSYSLGGSEYFGDLTEFSPNNIPEKPDEVISLFFKRNPIIELDMALRENMMVTLKNRQYRDLCTMLMFDARSIFHERYPKDTCKFY